MFKFSDASRSLQSLAAKAEAARGSDAAGWEPLTNGGARVVFEDGSHRDFSKNDLLEEQSLIAPRRWAQEDDFEDWRG